MGDPKIIQNPSYWHIIHNSIHGLTLKSSMVRNFCSPQHSSPGMTWRECPMSCEKCYEMLRLARAELQAECFIIENQDLWWLQCDRTSPRHHVFLQKPSIKSLESSWIQIRLWMRPMFGVFSRFDLPSGKLSHNYGKPPFFMGKSTISMAMFNSYVSLPEGTFP